MLIIKIKQPYSESKQAMTLNGDVFLCSYRSGGVSFI